MSPPAHVGPRAPGAHTSSPVTRSSIPQPRAAGSSFAALGRPEYPPRRPGSNPPAGTRRSSPVARSARPPGASAEPPRATEKALIAMPRRSAGRARGGPLPRTRHLGHPPRTRPAPSPARPPPRCGREGNRSPLPRLGSSLPAHGAGQDRDNTRIRLRSATQADPRPSPARKRAAEVRWFAPPGCRSILQAAKPLSPRCQQDRPRVLRRSELLTRLRRRSGRCAPGRPNPGRRPTPCRLRRPRCGSRKRSRPPLRPLRTRR